MRLLITIAIIVGCYACSQASLKQGDTSKASDTADSEKGTSDQKGNETRLVSSALEESESDGGVFKSFPDAGRGKGDTQQTWTGSFIANKEWTQPITYGSTTVEQMITMESAVGDRSYRSTTPALDTKSQDFTQSGREATTRRPANEKFRGEEYKGLLDLLIVADVSDSMENKIENVRDNLNKLIPKIDNTDWKILIMNSESKSRREDECRRRATNDKSKFRTELNNLLDETSGWRENIPWQTRKGLATCKGPEWRNGSPYWPKNTSRSWMREGSTLAVLVITDEDFQCSQCQNNRCEASPLLCKAKAPDALPELKCNTFHCSFRGLASEFSAYRADKKKLAFYAIFNTPETKCKDMAKNGRAYNSEYGWFNRMCKRSGSGSCAQRRNPTNPCYRTDSMSLNKDNRRFYRHNIDSVISNLSGGGIFTMGKDINSGNFNSVLSAISSDIEGRLNNRFQLDCNRNNCNIDTVTVNKQEMNTWEHQGRYLIFTDNLPDENDRITVTYRDYTTARAEPYQTTFTLNDYPDLNTVRVKVNDIPLNRSNWQLSGDTIELRCGGSSCNDEQAANLTPSGSRITVEYKRRPQEARKQKTFTLNPYGSTILPGSVRVAKGNGSYTSSGFSFNGTRVTFDSGNEPDHGQLVSFQYKTVTNKYYDYPFPAASEASNVRCTKGGSPVRCTVRTNNNTIYFPDTTQFPIDVQGVEVTVTYDKPQDRAFTMNLDPNYVKESVTLTSGDTCNHEQLVFSGNELNLAKDSQKSNGCSFLRNPSIGQQMSLFYRTVNQSFTISSPELEKWRGIYKIEVWEVTVNGQPTTDYTINNNTLSLNSDLGTNATVAVVVSLMN